MEVRLVEIPATVNSDELKALLDRFRAGQAFKFVLPQQPREAASVPRAEKPFEQGILTEPETRKLLEFLQREPGLDLVLPPKVVTVSGRQVRVALEPDEDPVLDPPFHAPAKPRK